MSTQAGGPDRPARAAAPQSRPARAPMTTTTPAGLRLVAALEGGKGIVVVLAGFGVLAIVHEGAAQFAEALIGHLHLNPAKGVPRVFVGLMADTSNRQLRLLAAGAAVYAIVQIVEAYGLWRARAWAEWLAAAGGAIYIPFEIAKLAEGVTPLGVGMLLVNVVVVAFMLRTLRLSRAGRG